MQKFFGFSGDKSGADQKRNSNSHYQIMDNDHAAGSGTDADAFNPYTSNNFNTPMVQKPAGVGSAEATKGEISNIEKLYNKVLCKSISSL